MLPFPFRRSSKNPCTDILIALVPFFWQYSHVFFSFVAGLLLAPLIGIEGDEPLFAQAMYPPRVELYTLEYPSPSKSP